jgi:putative sugar O-methyltransferase
MDIVRESREIIKTEGILRYCHRILRRMYRNFNYLFVWAEMKWTHEAHFQLKDFTEGQKQIPAHAVRSAENSISQIIKSYNHAIKDQPSQPDAYKISGDWVIIFNSDQQELTSSLKDEDISKTHLILSNFARNKSSRGLHLYDTIPQSFFHRLMLLNSFNKSYLVWKKLTGLPDSVLEYPKEIGNMHGMGIDGKSIMLPSFNQSYFAQRIENLLGRLPKKAVILEIGGGYGSIPYHLFKHTSLKVTYVLVDLPEMCTLASYFLMNHFPDKKVLLYGDGPVDFSNLTDYDIVILPNFCLPQLPSQSFDLVFNSHSMCQMEPATLKEYLFQINRICTGFFLHANNEEDLTSLMAPDKKYVNLNSPEFELPKENFRKIYRFPELIRNDGFLCPEYCSWEYLYQRIR